MGYPSCDSHNVYVSHYSNSVDPLSRSQEIVIYVKFFNEIAVAILYIIRRSKAPCGKSLLQRDTAIDSYMCCPPSNRKMSM